MQKKEDECFHMAAKWMSQTFLRYLNVIIGIIFFYQFRPGQFEMLSNDIFKSRDHRFLVLEYRKIGVCSVLP